MLTLLFSFVLHCVLAFAFTRVVAAYDGMTTLIVIHGIWLLAVGAFSWRMGRVAGHIAVIAAAIAVLPALPVADMLWSIFASGNVVADQGMLLSAYQAHAWRIWLVVVVAAYAAWMGAWRYEQRDRNRPNPFAAAAFGLVPGLGFVYIGRMSFALVLLFVPVLGMLLVLTSLDSAVAAKQFVWVVGIMLLVLLVVSVLLPALIALQLMHKPQSGPVVVFSFITGLTWFIAYATHGFLTGKEILVADEAIGPVQQGDWVVADRTGLADRRLRSGELVGVGTGELLRVVASAQQKAEWRNQRLYLDGVAPTVELLADGKVAELTEDGSRYTVIPGPGELSWANGNGYVLLPDDRRNLPTMPAVHRRYEHRQLAGPVTYVLLNTNISPTRFSIDFARRGMAIAESGKTLVDN